MFYISLKSTYARLAYILDQSDESLFPLVESPESRVLLGAVPRANLEEVLRRQLNAPQFAAPPPGLRTRKKRERERERRRRRRRRRNGKLEMTEMEPASKT